MKIKQDNVSIRTCNLVLTDYICLDSTFLKIKAEKNYMRFNSLFYKHVIII